MSAKEKNVMRIAIQMGASFCGFRQQDQDKAVEAGYLGKAQLVQLGEAAGRTVWGGRETVTRSGKALIPAARSTRCPGCCRRMRSRSLR